MADNKEKREVRQNSKSGGNDAKAAPATMPKGEKPSSSSGESSSSGSDN